MRMKQLLRPCVMLWLAGTLTAATAQGVLRPCSSLPPAERESASAIGACREVAPIVDVAPRDVQTAPPVIVPVPRVVGLSFDDARDRLAGFTVRRSYVPSAEAGGTILEQQPAPPARLAAGSIVRVVLSDGTLRPAPRVPATEIDGVRKPPDTPAPAASVPREAPQPAPSAVAQSNQTEARMPSAPNAPASPRSNAEARNTPAASKAALPPRGAATPSKAPASRAKLAQVPVRSAVAPSPAPAIETFELPNVIGRSSDAASAALAEFKVERIEVVANAAPSGQVLAQDPAPGTLVATGSAIGLQVSDGSLASVTTAKQALPVAPSPARSAAPAPTRVPVTFPSTAVLLLIAGVLLGLGFGALLMRRWLAKRQAADAEAFVPAAVPPTIDHAATPLEATVEKAPLPGASAAPALALPIAFAARLDEGETTIEFTAPSDADEMTLEYSREFHE